MAAPESKPAATKVNTKVSALPLQALRTWYSTHPHWRWSSKSLMITGPIMSVCNSSTLARQWARHCVSWQSRFLCCLSSQTRTQSHMQPRSLSGLKPLRKSKMTLNASLRRIRNYTTFWNRIALLQWFRIYVHMLTRTRLKTIWMALA